MLHNQNDVAHVYESCEGLRKEYFSQNEQTFVAASGRTQLRNMIAYIWDVLGIARCPLKAEKANEAAQSRSHTLKYYHHEGERGVPQPVLASCLDEHAKCDRRIKMAAADGAEYLEHHHDTETEAAGRVAGHTAPVEENHYETCAQKF